MESEGSKMLSTSNQEEEDSAAKKSDSDESVVALIQKPTLLRLIPDILEEILPQFSLGLFHNYYKKLHFAEALRKFMASGKEPFNAALRYFSHVKSVMLTPVYLIIFVKRYPVRKNDEVNWHMIPYDFEYLDKLLVVLVKFNKYFCINFKYDALNDIGKRVFAHLVQKNLQSLRFEALTIPADYIIFFKKECSFKEVQIDLCGVEQPSDTDFLEIPASKHCIITHFQSFYHRILSFPQDRTFPVVKQLFIESSSVCDCTEEWTFMFTKDAIKNFFDRLAGHFHNLQTVDVSFLPEFEKLDTDWDTVYAEMKKFTPQTFSTLPSHLKGSISFCYGDSDMTINQVLEELEAVDDGIEVVDNSHKIPFEESKLIKKFDIHDGLTFIYEFCLSGGEIFKDPIVQWQQLNSDDSDDEEDSSDESEHENSAAD